MKPNQWNRQGYVVPKPTTTNFAGNDAYVRSLDEQVLQCAMTGSTANLFYMNADANVEHMIETFRKMDNIDLFKKILLYARENGYNRSAPICGLAVLSTKDINAFKEVAPRILKNPKDVQSFIDLCRSKKVREGMGRGVKKVIIGKINDITEYHAMKYPEACLDMVNVARPKPTPMVDYIKTGKIGEDMLKLQAYDFLKKVDDVNLARKLIDAGSLPYEAVSSQVGKFGNDAGVWTALFNQAPYMNLLRNVNTFYRHGVFDDPNNVSKAVARITDINAIKKSMIYPFQFYIAHENIENNLKLAPIKRALESALELSVANVPDIEGRVAIATDCSGSMSGNLLGDKGVLQCIDVAALFTAILSYKCAQKPAVIPFTYDIQTKWMGDNYGRVQGILNRAKLFQAGGGTSLSAPVKSLRINKYPVDKLIVFTDSEEWYGDNFIEEFLLYRRTVAPNCKAYLVQLMPYPHAVAPESVKDVTYIYGWSESILKIVTSDVDKQLSEVRKM